MIKFIGYGLIAFAGSVMRCAGLTLDQWESWAIILGFVVGCSLTHYEEYQ